MSTDIFAGDPKCYGYTSKTDHFECTSVGNCTWWAAYTRPDLAIVGITGDAANWFDNARKLGFSTGSKPVLGAIAVFSSPGHVAFVKLVYGDGSFDVSEMDATGRLGSGGVYYATYHPDGNGKYHRNDGAPNGWTLKGFIYGLSDATPQSGQKIVTAFSGKLYWTPHDVECQNATRWYRTDAIGELKLIADRFRIANWPSGGYASPAEICSSLDVTAVCKP